jgi:hypothetical protein
MGIPPAHGQDCVVLSIGQYQAGPGEAVWVAVDCSDVTGLDVYSAFLRVDFPGDVLSVLDVSLEGTIADGFFSAWNESPVEGNLWKVEIAIAGNEPMVGAGPMVYILFQVAEDVGDTEAADLVLSGYLNEGNPCVETHSGQILFPPSAAPMPGWPPGPGGLWMRSLGNPAGRQLGLEIIGLPPGPFRLRLRDASGRLVREASLRKGTAAATPERIRLSLDGLASGVYFVEALGPTGRTTLRVIHVR